MFLHDFTLCLPVSDLLGGRAMIYLVKRGLSGTSVPLSSAHGELFPGEKSGCWLV